MACKKDHSSIQSIMESLPIDQGGDGRHKCAACAYEQGFLDGQNMVLQIDLNRLLDSLEDSQARNQRHKSPLAAYAQGYKDGITYHYSN